MPTLSRSTLHFGRGPAISTLLYSKIPENRLDPNDFPTSGLTDIARETLRTVPFRSAHYSENAVSDLFLSGWRSKSVYGATLVLTQ